MKHPWFSLIRNTYHIEASIYDSICRLIAFFYHSFPSRNAQVSRAGEQKRHPQTDVPEVHASLFWIAAAVWLVALLKFSRRDTGSSRWWREGMENVGGWKHGGGKLKHFPAVRREPDGDVQRLLLFVYEPLSPCPRMGWMERGRGRGRRRYNPRSSTVAWRLVAVFARWSTSPGCRDPSKSRFTRESAKNEASCFH